MNMLDMFLDVCPTPKARPRMTKSGNVYNTAKTRNAERDIRLLIQNEICKKQIHITDKPVIVKIRFNYQLPNKMSKKDKLLADLDMLYKVSRPDIDNLVKLCMDSMNNLIYFDDGQVVKLVCEKRYSMREGIELKVMEL
jgi:Holliday junction resolvase RusA-like endonuclease